LDHTFAFITTACVPRDAPSHTDGTLEQADQILAQHPEIAFANIHTAAILGDEQGVRRFLALDPAGATSKGGPHGWDALTHLCFSRYLRLDASRSDAFVATARALLDAGASANTGWTEMWGDPTPQPVFESVTYGAAAVARHPGMTRLLLEYGADPNDGETPYHVPESYDNTVMKILLDSGKLTATSLTWLLARKADIHDEHGLRMALDYGANPNTITRWGRNALQHAVLRDNRLSSIELLLDHSAEGRSVESLAARRGRGDVLEAIEKRGVALAFQGVDHLIAACARGQHVEADPSVLTELLTLGGTLLAQFAGNGNVDGIGRLLDLGVSPGAIYAGDPYFDEAPSSTALHVAAWRAQHSAVKLLIDRGAPVNALDGKGRSALALAVKACVDSYWKDRRSPESVELLLQTGASASGITIPSGYPAVDQLFGHHTG
jgi:ankyrin repeat protein